jgi:hypothetical protein
MLTGDASMLANIKKDPHEVKKANKGCRGYISQSPGF